jgi:hypothetical protein
MTTLRRRPVSPAILACGLFAASLPVLAREARRGRHPHALRMLAGAELVKLGGAFIACRAIEWRHPEGTDPDDYHTAGDQIATALRAGRLEETPRLARSVPFDTRLPLAGTNAVRLITGCVYTATGPSKQNGFVVFSWLGFWGQLLFYRAFAAGIPEGDLRRYGQLVFFLPSLVFWTSSLGKEPLLVLGMGTGALGAARVTRGEVRAGVVLLALGGAFTVWLRPHVLGIARKGLRKDLEEMTALTAQGETDFMPASPGGAGGALKIALTTLFRPLPHEARNPRALAAALESSLVLYLTARRAHAIAAGLRAAPRRPYVAAAGVATAALTAVLGGVANFGLLNRQRAPTLPFYFVLLCAARRR